MATTKYQIIFWRDIPLQVRVKSGRSRTSHPLPDRFQKAVYRAAYRARAITGQDFIDQWHPSEWRTVDGEPDVVIETVAAQIEREYPEARLQTLIAKKGFEANDT